MEEDKDKILVLPVYYADSVLVFFFFFFFFCGCIYIIHMLYTCCTVGKRKKQSKSENKKRLVKRLIFNRRFPEITGKDNLTVFSYSARVKSPEWRRQLRRADLRHFETFQAWTYYNLY